MKVVCLCVYVYMKPTDRLLWSNSLHISLKLLHLHVVLQSSSQCAYKNIMRVSGTIHITSGVPFALVDISQRELEDFTAVGRRGGSSFHGLFIKDTPLTGCLGL